MGESHRRLTHESCKPSLIIMCLGLAEDPPASEVIYLHKYFQIFNYFISQDSKNVGLSCRNTTTDKDKLLIVEESDDKGSTLVIDLTEDKDHGEDDSEGHSVDLDFFS